MAAAPLQHDSSNAGAGWRAELRLKFERQGERTVLARREHIGPLVVQRPFYPEGGVCHVYLVHPPGGIVGGDQVSLECDVDDGSHVVVTTPAATKFYRSLANRKASLRQQLSIRCATLEWLPQETILFRDTHATIATAIRMDAASRFIGWEQSQFGRPSSNEIFDAGDVQQRFELWIDEQPVFLDRLRIEQKSAAAEWGLAGKPLLSTLLAYPATASDLESAREHEDFACTLVDRILCCRLLNSDSDAAKRSMIALWQTLRPRIIGKAASPPRIWAT
jgi:urease accessory protein